MSHIYAIVPSSVKPVSRSSEPSEDGFGARMKPLVGRLASRWHKVRCIAIVVALACFAGLTMLVAGRGSMAGFSFVRLAECDLFWGCAGGTTGH